MRGAKKGMEEERNRREGGEGDVKEELNCRKVAATSGGDGKK